jgi:hypothetical protein
LQAVANSGGQEARGRQLAPYRLSASFRHRLRLAASRAVLFGGVSDESRQYAAADAPAVKGDDAVGEIAFPLIIVRPASPLAD